MLRRRALEPEGLLVPSSGASGVREVKPYAMKAAEKTIEDYLKRIGSKGKVITMKNDLRKIHWEI